MGDIRGLRAEGTAFFRGDGEDTEYFAYLGAVTGISGLGGGSPTVLDPTTLGDSFRRKLLGLRDEGQLTLVIQWDASDEQFQGMIEDRREAVLRNFEIVFPDDTLVELSGFVMTFEISANTDELITVNCQIEIDGEMEFTFAS